MTLLKTYNTHPVFLFHSFQSRYSPLTSTTTSSTWVRRFRGLVKRTMLPRVLGLWRVLCSNSESSSDDCLCVTTTQCSTWWPTWTGVKSHYSVFLSPLFPISTYQLEASLAQQNISHPECTQISRICVSNQLILMAKIVTQQTLLLIKQWPKKH